MKKNPYGNMHKAASRTAFLIAGYIRGTLSEKEHDELDNWINESDQNMQLFEDLTDEQNVDANLAWMNKVDVDTNYKKLEQEGKFWKQRVGLLWIWIAAASIALLIGLFLGSNNSGAHNVKVSRLAHAELDLNPGTNRATLKLSDGSQVDLASVTNGLITADSGTEIFTKADGQIIYSSENSGSNDERINLLSTPAGGQFQVTLSDGTRIWLNAASALKYPSKFGADVRSVSITGEAYFEVAKDSRRPFHVLLPDSSVVSVLGTHFNIMSYQNEESKRITLLEGSVSVETGGQAERLSPGMQAMITGNKLTVVKKVDTDEVTGWKNGFFIFHDAPIQSIMRQVERWYDAEVEYQDQIDLHLNATIERNVPVSKLLHIFEETNQVKFRIEGKKIVVMK